MDKDKIDEIKRLIKIATGSLFFEDEAGIGQMILHELAEQIYQLSENEWQARIRRIKNEIEKGMEICEFTAPSQDIDILRHKIRSIRQDVWDGIWKEEEK